MIATIFIIGKMQNCATDRFRSTDREGALKISHIFPGIPQAKFYIGKKFDFLDGITGIFQGNLLNLTVEIHRHKSQNLS